MKSKKSFWVISIIGLLLVVGSSASSLNLLDVNTGNVLRAAGFGLILISLFFKPKGYDPLSQLKKRS